MLLKVGTVKPCKYVIVHTYFKYQINADHIKDEKYLALVVSMNYVNIGFENLQMYEICGCCLHNSFLMFTIIIYYCCYYEIKLVCRLLPQMNS